MSKQQFASLLTALAVVEQAAAEVQHKRAQEAIDSPVAAEQQAGVMATVMTASHLARAECFSRLAKEVLGP